jgi:UDP-N-acetyl-D-mannosaminuronic acid dehydrogenase
MSSTKPTETNTSEEKGEHVVSIVGCGRLGLLHACLLANAGFRVICVDSDQALIDRIVKGKIPFLKHELEPVLKKNLADGRIKVTSDLKIAVAQSSAVMVTTSVSVNDKGKVDYSPLEKILKSIGSTIYKGTLIIITSVVGIGITEGLVKDVLESSSGFKIGLDFYLAYSPVLFPEKQTFKELSSCKRIVAALDKTSLETALKIIGAITNANIIKTQNVRAAEAAVLFMATFENVNSKMTIEFAIFCERLGLDYLEVCNISDSVVGMSLKPTLADKDSPEALMMLLEEAENFNVKLCIPETAMKLEEEVLRHGFELIREALKSCGKPLRRAKIAMLGLSQTPNTADVPRVYAKRLGGMLVGKGAKLTAYDPYLFDKTSTDFEQIPVKKSLSEAVKGADCIAILTGHEQFKRLNLKKLKLLVKMPAAIVDLEGVLEPAKVEAESFIYLGFGRGVWKK